MEITCCWLNNPCLWQNLFTQDAKKYLQGTLTQNTNMYAWVYIAPDILTILSTWLIVSQQT